jgi:hypothetical protein
MSDVQTMLQRQVEAVEHDNRLALSEWQAKPLAERAEAISACCRLAMTTLEARRSLGLPAPVREPWPASTLDLLRKHAADARHRSFDA